MAAPRFLISYCNNSSEPTIAMFDNLSKQQFEEIVVYFKDNKTVCGKESNLGCFTFLSLSEDSENIIVYGDIELFSNCDDCSFSNNIDRFKSNTNVTDKYENTKSTISDIISAKTRGGK